MQNISKHPLQRLRNQYHSLYPPHLITFPAPHQLALARHQEWLYDNLLNNQSIGVEYTPAKDFQRKFWKLLIAALEEELRQDSAEKEELELDDRIAEHYTALLSLSSNPFDVPGPSYKTYIYPSSASSSSLGSRAKEQAITLLEAQTTIEAGSTGLRTWTASLYLATQFLLSPDSLLTHPSSPSPKTSPASTSSGHETKRRTVLELGSGTGFFSSFLAQQGLFREIIASDLGDEWDYHHSHNEAEVGRDQEEQEELEEGRKLLQEEEEERVRGTRKNPLGTLRGNLLINKPRFPPDAQVRSVPLDWFHSISTPCTYSSGQIESPVDSRAHARMCQLSRGLQDDLILIAADVIYDPDLVFALVNTLKLFLSHGTERFALVAATVRNEDTTGLFLETCGKLGLNVLEMQDLVRQEEGHESIFWNASTWEGEDVRIMKIWYKAV